MKYNGSFTVKSGLKVAKNVSSMKYKLAEHISLTELDDEAVLLDLNVGAYYGLNHVGTRFINALQAQQPAEQAINDIAMDYQNIGSDVRQDLKELLSQLLDQKLIVINEK